MAKSSNTPKGRPSVMPKPKRAPNPRTPKPVRLEGANDVEEEGTAAAVAEGQAVEPPVYANNSNA